MKIRTVILALALASTLSACIPIAATGVGIGIAATIDRRTYGTQIEDGSIESRLESRIKEKLGSWGRVSVTSFNRIVLISGEVPSESAKQEAAQQVSTLPYQIRVVHNEIRVASKASFTRQSGDALVTSNLKTLLLGSKVVSGAQVKVITESGTVYLMGILTQRESDEAVRIATAASGVHKVVNLAEIVSEEQAKALDHPTESPAKTSH
ncbi:BON domain-containing protein [Niveibacterium terrae]|uniref:BON domain-containing protein n=1 Tax=Niveibacterium terrae TaxID=3373598 RepID=UPI003A92704A